MASYVDITREEFEEWLDSTKFRGKWSIKSGTVGVYVLALSERVAIEVSSSLTSGHGTMGHGEAAMQTRLVSLITRQVLNKKAQGQAHFKRTKNWRTTLGQGLDRMEDAYRKSEAFYEALAEIENRDKYKAEMLALIEGIPGWEQNSFLTDLHTRLDGNGILTPKQKAALERTADRVPKQQPPPSQERLDVNRLRALWWVLKNERDQAGMRAVQDVGEALKGGGNPSRDQARVVGDLLRMHEQQVDQAMRQRKFALAETQMDLLSQYEELK